MATPERSEWQPGDPPVTVHNMDELAERFKDDWSIQEDPDRQDRAQWLLVLRKVGPEGRAELRKTLKNLGF